MKTILLPKRTLVFVFFIASLLFSNISFGQTVLLDQADLDYAPGETVYITGFGWHPGETVILEVANLTNPNVDCGPVSPQPHVSWTTVADENGNFIASWYVNDCELGADLLLGALGETSGFTYEVFFTDANVSFKANGLPNGTNVTVNYRVYSTGSPGGSFTAINFTTPNNSTPAIAVNNSQTVEYTFNDVVISGTTYKAIGGTAVGANNGAGGQVITANYIIACTTPAAPVVISPVTYCQGATATALTATGSNLLWYTSLTGGIGSTTPPTPSTASIGTTSYYVSQSTDCESTRAKIDVVINGIVAGVIGKGAVQPGPGCGTLDPGITSNTTAVSGSGTLSYTWQQSTDGGSNWSTIPSATSSQYNPPALAITTFFKRIVTSNLNGINCTAESNILVYEVNPLPVVSAVLPGGTTNVCIGNTLQLSNATQGGVWNSQNTAIATVDSSGLVSGITSGDVTISYTVTDPNSGCFKTVNKTVHVLALPVAPIAIDYSGVYDGVAHTGSATVNSGEVIYWYTTATGTTTSSAPSGTNVGTYSAYAESRNMSTGCISPIRTLVTVSITPKSATIVADGKSKIYGEVNPLLTAQISGTVNGDTLDYSLATTATQFSGVGSYPIAIILGSNPNYSITPTNSELTITPKSATIVADGKTKIYGEVNPLLTAQISGTVNGDALDYSLATTATQFSGVGSYPIAITLGSNPNYSITPTDSELTITPKSATIVADGKTKIYGEVNPLLTAQISGTVNGDALDYSLATTATQFSGVGSYPIAITLGSNPNYSITPTDSELTITPKSATIVADGKTKIYGEVNPLLTAQISGTVNGDVLDYSLATTATQFSGVGSYPIAITLGSNPNYSITPTDSELTITPKSATIVADGKTKIYGEVNPLLTAQVSGTVNGDALDYSLATTATQFSGVGSYPIEITLGSNPNYSITPTNSELTITPKSATIVADGKTKIYGEVNPLLTAQVSGTVNGDALDYSLVTTATQFSGVGSYPIAITLGSNPNYSITPANSELTITPKSATIVADGKTKIYGEVNPLLTAQVSGTVNGDALDYSLATTATQFSGVGSYPIAITLGSNPNYSITPTNSELTITPKSASVTPVASSKYCGQSDPISFTGTTSGFLASDNIIVNYSRTGGESAGIYTISASISSSPSTVINNYNITYNSANFTIIGINSVDASASSTPVALGSVATLSAKIIPAVSGVTVYFSLSSGVGNVQTYTGITDANGLASTQVFSLVVDLYKVIATAGSGCAVSTEAYMPVYDPNGSFVTGGGWINSPAGAYTANLSLVGKANFGFNAKYKKGNNQVDGNTEFQFKAGDLNFKSTLHESGSLVISGKKATYRGDGTINGVPGYKFTLVAIDGNYNSGTAPDQFRIKIWGPNGVVYDNGLGADENSEVSTVLAGGSIVIHEVKKKGSAKDVTTEKTHSTMFSDAAQDPILFNVIAYPNPSINYFTLSVETGSTENVQVLLYDSAGRLLKVIDRKVGEIIQFGEDLPRGTYIAKITQGVESKTINLMKK